MSKQNKSKYVVVATKTRRWCVLAGELESASGDTVVLRNARMIVYYSSDAHGLYGVAAGGPGASARVSPAVDEATVHGVESVLSATDAARTAIIAEPWS